MKNNYRQEAVSGQLYSYNIRAIFFKFYLWIPQRPRPWSRGSPFMAYWEYICKIITYRLRRGRVITNAYCRNHPYHSLLCYRNSGRNETSTFEAGVGKDSTDTRHKLMAILGGNNVTPSRSWLSEADCSCPPQNVSGPYSGNIWQQRLECVT